VGEEKETDVEDKCVVIDGEDRFHTLERAWDKLRTGTVEELSIMSECVFKESKNLEKFLNLLSENKIRELLCFPLCRCVRERKEH